MRTSCKSTLDLKVITVFVYFFAGTVEGNYYTSTSIGMIVRQKYGIDQQERQDTKVQQTLYRSKAEKKQNIIVKERVKEEDEEEKDKQETE